MIRTVLVSFALLIVLSSCSKTDPGVMYQVLVLKDGSELASPSLVGEFDQMVAFSVGDEVRVEMMTLKDNQPRQMVSASIYFPEQDSTAPEHEFEARMDLSLTPSFQYSSQDKRYRIEIRPRAIDLPANRAET